LATRAITSLAYAGRPEVGDVIDLLKQHPFVSDGKGGGWNLDSAIVDAAFFHDLIQDRGFEYLKQYYGTDELSRQFPAWRNSENGKQWVEWIQQWRKDHPTEASK